LPEVKPELATALAFDRLIRRGAAAEAIPLAGALVLRHSALPDVHHLNALMLDAPAQLGADDVVALADHWLGDRRHRHVVFDDCDAGERIAAELADAGWERRRTLFMTFAGDPAAIIGDGRAREVSEVELRGLQRAGLAEAVSPVDARRGLLAQLAAAQDALRAGTPARGFGAGEDGELQSMATLFLGADVGGRRVAMVDEVGTLILHRQRGLARAAVSAAVGAALSWGAELIVVTADADDWPQLLYARLGFEPAGRQVTLTLRGRAGSDSSPAAV
jgi:hypothetical protein